MKRTPSSTDDGPASKPGRRLRALLLPTAPGEAAVAASPRVGIRTLMRRFWPIARPYRRQIVAGLVFVALVPAVQSAEIWLFKLAFDEVVVPAELGPLAWIAPVVIGLAALGGLIGFGEDYTWTWAGERFLLDLRVKFFSHVQKLSLPQLGRRQTGDLLSRLSGDVQAIESFVLGGLAEIVSAAARIAFFGGALFLLDWRLALVSLVVVPPFALSARWFSRLAKEAAREKRRRSGSLGAVAEESLTNTALVQSSGRLDHERERVRREGEGIVQAELASARVSGAYAPVSTLIELAGVLSIIALGTWSVQEGRLTVGGVLAFLAYLSQLLRPIADLGHLVTTLFAASAGGERVLELLDEEPEIRDRPGAVALGRARGALELEAVTFRHVGSLEPTLETVSLSIEAGEIVAVTGPSGAGKSTIARLLMRFADPGNGVVRLDGRDLRECKLDSVRANVGYLQQETLLFDASVGENIAYGRPEASQDEIEAAARSARAHEFVTALPAGYDTRVGPRGGDLSGGQRRRVEVARTLLRDTPVVVLDEPTTGLEGAEATKVGEALRELLQGRTAVVVTHDPALVETADRTIVVRDGRIVTEEGVVV